MTGKLHINTDLCMGCCACEVACKMEYDLPRGVRFIIMRQSETKAGAEERLQFRFDICRHCQDARCAQICPANAIYKREDGIVLVNEDRCTGCKECAQSCPWNIPQFDEISPGRIVMKKCSMCASRLDQGLPPACATACPAGAIRIG